MSDPNPARFYMVFNPAANPPTYMHGGKQSAIDEAKRLAAKCPGKRFFVLEALEAYQVDLPEPRRIELGGNAQAIADSIMADWSAPITLARRIERAGRSATKDDIPF
ncbi:hypothetical protein RvVAR031_36320 [Agrobacterium vitis]|uniref:hypothetical protein n=1 Tax=Agrobacterium vitis TaxID=373 RepID=UPI0015DAFB94|nr:hypothetical protein [Agrobacterium vitis]BCH56022.1 hypothetical protein RvVAR031_36320 [Agrobacterium vitis]